ncbi:MAG: trypsin-like peptidase domain-containing protein [Rubrobacteraceae bacterium]
MENLKESLEMLKALSDGMADAVEKAGTFVVRVNSRRRRGASGVVRGADTVLMADHSLQREEGITVEKGDGRKLPARVLGRDPASDLALLEVEGLGGEVAAASEEPARVGQISLAVGRPGREGLRAGFGVVSAVGRSLRVGRGTMMERYVQTEATPYPGLGGGPLIDVHGNVLGVITAGMMRGITLAVPTDVAWQVAETLETQGHVKRGYLGILSQPVNLSAAQRTEGRDRGLLIVGVEEGSPAGRGGLLTGDILVGLDGRAVEDTDELQALLTGERVGKEVEVEVIRGGEPHAARLTIGQRG